MDLLLQILGERVERWLYRRALVRICLYGALLWCALTPSGQAHFTAVFRTTSAQLAREYEQRLKHALGLGDRPAGAHQPSPHVGAGRSR